MKNIYVMLVVVGIISMPLHLLYAQGLQIVGNAQMNMQTGTHLFMQTGSTTLSIDNSSTLRGVGTITGDITNNGTIQTGNPTGTLTINGNLNNQATINVELAGIGANQYDLIAVNGSGVIAGTINVSYLGSYVLPTMADVDIITTTGLTYSAIENNPPTAAILNTGTNVYLGLGVYLSATITKLMAERRTETIVGLTWTTTQETNNKGFEVEMSKNGRDYTTIAFVEGRGNTTTVSSYQLAVNNPSDSYYRLRQVDFGGTFSYSSVVFVEGIDVLKVYPNPNNGTFTISAGKHTFDLPARLLNAQGIEVWRGVQTEVRTTGLPAGMYFLHTTVAGKAKVTKVVIR